MQRENIKLVEVIRSLKDNYVGENGAYVSLDKLWDLFLFSLLVDPVIVMYGASWEITKYTPQELRVLTYILLGLSVLLVNYTKIFELCLTLKRTLKEKREAVIKVSRIGIVCLGIIFLFHLAAIVENGTQFQVGMTLFLYSMIFTSLGTATKNYNLFTDGEVENHRSNYELELTYLALAAFISTRAVSFFGALYSLTLPNRFEAYSYYLLFTIVLLVIGKPDKDDFRKRCKICSSFVSIGTDYTAECPSCSHRAAN